MAVTDGLAIKIVNIVVFAALLGSNIYSVAGPEDIYRSGRETWVTPSYYANYVWSLIHLLLLFLMFYQFTERGKQMFVDTVQWRFALLAVLNQAFVWLWYKHWYITAFILSLLVSATVSQIYYTIESSESRGQETIADELLVHTPFSLWHGWSLVLVVLSGFEAFGRSVHSHGGHTGAWTKVFVFFAFLFLESTAAAYAFSSREGDPAGAAVIAFYLFAVFMHQTGSGIHHDKFVKWTALVFFILSLFAILKSVYGTFRKGGSLLHDEERAPLIQGSSD
ncbi:hypothetical protein FFLO_00237 [Filobasidium floriforme]|uniref:Uncharacterized protein n=1 Tax=Filobasidium floriforme TaxID=5210 RepID=A0A8K0NVT3_9TREE|nr:hypothetical protein FFLO_00237 [Filobasidium floriforme]